MSNSNSYMNDYMKNRWRIRRQSAIRYLGGKCINCESTEYLQFHHVEPKNKSYNISKLSSVNITDFWQEIYKCKLLCNSCHKEEHGSKHPCGTPQKYWTGCRCSLYIEAKRAYARRNRHRYT